MLQLWSCKIISAYSANSRVTLCDISGARRSPEQRGVYNRWITMKDALMHFVASVRDVCCLLEIYKTTKNNNDFINVIYLYHGFYNDHRNAIQTGLLKTYYTIKRTHPKKV